MTGPDHYRKAEELAERLMSISGKERDRTTALSGPRSPRFTPPSPSLLPPRSGRRLPKVAPGPTPPELSTLCVHETCMLVASTVDLLHAIWRHGGRCRSLRQVSSSYWVGWRLVSSGTVAALWCCTFSGGSSQGLLICKIRLCCRNKASTLRSVFMSV